MMKRAPDKHGVSGRDTEHTMAGQRFTDANGRFIFPTVAPGTHQIYVDLVPPPSE
jgi:protocatechuate 3,4-dioxygenase beta subunit